MPANAMKDFDLRMRQTPCYGACPVYFVHVDSRGRVEAGPTPEQLVKAGRLSSDDLERLARAFYDAGFFNMPDKYPARATDGSPLIIEVRSSGRTKKVWSADPPRQMLGLKTLAEKMTHVLSYAHRGLVEIPRAAPAPNPYR